VSARTDRYLAAQIQRALAQDERTNELGIHVGIRENVVTLRGKVASDHRRSQVALVAHEAAPEMEIRNEVRVVPIRPPEDEERL
jgi:osmotically-inducible protein OsmY